MKKSIKLGALALALAVSFASCEGKKSSATGDTTVKAAKDSGTTTLPPPDTSKKPVDTAKKKM
ncbi:hypothetical protein BEL04_04760 [Mucilaginibacter sp. PPCGB 2223]|uniref:hypothetical protein n=1 Tax=Mucilaginibacter sp. PPCGB 2223 TaxID=1886027 RepID=UPI000824153A|nr:hypothetical protein [Mucilaginibacter sp. PPCGB 2223]OCX53608.1 hypothetical protein BEL04_04760 [Mucilaginibacter sp. PPCGB 2223]